MPRKVMITRDGMTLDLVLHEELGDTTLLKEAYALNPGLAFKPIILTPGDEVLIPDMASGPEIREVVRLWTE